MSRDLYLSVQIEASLNEALAQRIVHRGTELGCVYLQDRYSSKSLLDSTELLSEKEAVNQILQGIAYLDAQSNTIIDVTKRPQVCIRLSGTVFSLFFRKNGGLAFITLDPSIYVWCKNNDIENGYKHGYIDWERYISFMFALCKDWIILSVETYDSYYNE